MSKIYVIVTGSRNQPALNGLAGSIESSFLQWGYNNVNVGWRGYNAHSDLLQHNAKIVVLSEHILRNRSEMNGTDNNCRVTPAIVENSYRSIVGINVVAESSSAVRCVSQAIDKLLRNDFETQALVETLPGTGAINQSVPGHQAEERVEDMEVTVLVLEGKFLCRFGDILQHAE